MDDAVVDLSTVKALFVANNFQGVIDVLEPRFKAQQFTEVAEFQYLAVSWARVGRSDEGRAALEALLERDWSGQTRAGVLSSLGQVHLAAGRREQGISLVDDALRLSPDDVAILLTRAGADTQFSIATDDGVRAAYRAVELEPANRWALETATHLSVLLRRQNAARRYGEQTLGVAPNSWIAHADLGLIYAQRLRLLRSARHVGEALRLAPAQNVCTFSAWALVAMLRAAGTVTNLMCAVVVAFAPRGSGHPVWLLVAACLGPGVAVGIVAATRIVGGRGVLRALWRSLAGRRWARRGLVVWAGTSVLLVDAAYAGMPDARISAYAVIFLVIVQDLVIQLVDKGSLVAKQRKLNEFMSSTD